LPEVRVLGQVEFPDGGIQVRVIHRAEVRNCPECGHGTRKVHDRREQAKHVIKRVNEQLDRARMPERALSTKDDTCCCATERNWTRNRRQDWPN